MVSRLTFKGEGGIKKKKKKVVRRALAKEPKLEIDPELIASSWTSAITPSDIQGPIIITQEDTENVPQVICPDGLGGVLVRKDLGLADTPLNFPPEGSSSSAYITLPIHKTEPIDVHQVVVTVSLASITQQQATAEKVTLSLKTHEEKYLGKASSTELDCKSEAIGPAETIEFEKVIKDGVVYFRLCIGTTKVAIENGKAVLGAADVDSHDLFVIRVQAKNTVIGKRIIREHEESKASSTDAVLQSVKNAVISLQKDNIGVTTELLERLKKAALNGKLNEQVLDETLKFKNDTRC